MSYQYGLSGYFPGSARPQSPEEQALITRALELQGRGYNVGAHIAPADPYLGSSVTSGRLFYEHPGTPGYHFEQPMMEGDYRPPVMLPGNIQERYNLEHSLARAQSDWEAYMQGGGSPRPRVDLSPAETAYQAILAEATARARMGKPIRIPR